MINADELGQFMTENLRPFQPVAYFDKHMDCIRVLIQDVSITEVRLNKYFTVARSNNQPFSGKHVGFTIKGVAHLFAQVNLPVTGVLDLVRILDAIVKVIPHSAVKEVVEEFAPVLREKALSVNLDEEAWGLAA